MMHVPLLNNVWRLTSVYVLLIPEILFFMNVGLDVCEQFMDLMAHKSDSHLNGIDHRVFTSSSVHNIQKMVANMVPSVKSKWPSARELNLLKRKAKVNSKDQTKSWCEDGGTEPSSAQNLASKVTCPDSVNYNKVICYFTCYFKGNFGPSWGMLETIIPQHSSSQVSHCRQQFIC